jgi:transposase
MHLRVPEQIWLWRHGDEMRLVWLESYGHEGDPIADLLWRFIDLERFPEVVSGWHHLPVAARNPADLRERAVAAVDAGMARSEVARAYGVHPRTLERWVARARRGEPLADRPRSGRPPKIAPGQRVVLAAQVAAAPDATLAEHCERWARGTGTRVGRSTMARELARLGLTLKKSP